MSENLAPQNPDQPGGCTQPPEFSTPPQKPSKLDWRLVVIVGIAVLFLIAAYINRKWYSKPKPETPAAKESPAQAPTESGPPLTQAQMYALMLQRFELQSESRTFTAGGRTLILGSAPMPVGDDPAKEPERVLPGKLFDVTNMAEGLKPEMLHRREIYGTGQMATMDKPFLPLGLDKKIEMVLKPASEVTMDVVQDRQPVVGVTVGTESRAYPVRLMNYHEVINDTLGGEPVVVAWSALANAATASSRKLADGTTLTFGSAGLMFQDAIVLYSKDVRGEPGHEVESYSLWSATQRRCVAGERVNTPLAHPIQTELATWQTWKAMNPKTTVLTATNPVLPYNYENSLAAPQDYMNPRNPGIPDLVYGLDLNSPIPVKGRVFGVTGPDGQAVKAYLAGLLLEKLTSAEKSGKTAAPEAVEKAEKSDKAEKAITIEDTIGGRPVTLTFDAEHRTVSAKDADGKPLLTETMLWIAWVGAHPKTEVWQEAKLRAMQEGAKTAGATAGTTSAPAMTSAPATMPAPATSASPAMTSTSAGTGR